MTDINPTRRIIKTDDFQNTFDTTRFTFRFSVYLNSHFLIPDYFYFRKFPVARLFPILYIRQALRKLDFFVAIQPAKYS